MDILAIKDKTNLDKDLLSIIKLLKYKDDSVELIGSSKLKALQYFSDYDLNTYINKPSLPDLKKFILQVLHNINKYDRLYFIELKLETSKGRKVKFNPKTIKTLESKFIYDDLHFIKIDLVGYLQNRFIDISINYYFIKNRITVEEYIKELKTSIKELQTEKEYYKILKRKFNIYRAENNKAICMKLIKYFNSNVGKYYQLKSTLEAIELVRMYYKDKLTTRLILSELKSYKNTATISSIKTLKNKYKKICNTDAEKFISQLL